MRPYWMKDQKQSSLLKEYLKDRITNEIRKCGEDNIEHIEIDENKCVRVFAKNSVKTWFFSISY